MRPRYRGGVLSVRPAGTYTHSPELCPELCPEMSRSNDEVKELDAEDVDSGDCGKVYAFPDELAQEQARSAMLTTQLATATLIQGSATMLQSELGQERVRTADLSAQLTTATFSHVVASSVQSVLSIARAQLEVVTAERDQALSDVLKIQSETESAAQDRDARPASDDYHRAIPSA
ncbi:hypothetical protein BBJ29_010036 [Phytophthora kernoviae]|uniref:Uncharacterized protein n=1 Tax=Phytophthora kernoviae TaxID=325452 RepID=A0A3F2RAU0_9STRA|nr:hypothetical protein BBP00_00010047 [Phytophthora kernoviae]RLN66055.1 hypothetical protein BBJ29_010036 [Phytophthora kernoviae]